MSYEENYERRRSRSYFRTSMDIGMGIFYTVIGALIIFYKSFGTMTIPPVIAYLLGGMMVIGGLFRLYRGIKAILPAKKDHN
jgi:hypothetical protein